MPLDPYLLNPAQTKDMNDAYSSLVSTCMRSFGYDYALPAESSDPTGIGADAPTTRMDGYFGFQSMKHAEKWGFHPESGFPEVSGSPNTKATPNERVALSGTTDPHQRYGAGGQIVNKRKIPNRGCVGEAYRLLTGSVGGNPGNPDFVVKLKFATLAKGERDPRTLAVFSKWSACMKSMGYHYADPLRAAGDSAWGKTQLPSRHEIQVAVADQECRRTNNVVGIWFAVDYGYQQQAVQENLSHLTAIKNSMKAHLAAVRRALRA
ncbi:hypothetical protein ABZ357_40795 [Streptomyces sp. NPDC005917]|uniref:hypothetical protein n=1 Tax=unclassified Streptomyces TaxID=2593676 RepID=UPI0033E1BA41